MGDLFDKATRGKRLKSDDRVPGNLPFVTAGEADEGVSAFIGNTVRVFPKNTVTIDMFGSAKYRNYDYGCDDHVAVVHCHDLSKGAAIFLASAIHKSSYNGQFNYGRNFYAKDADTLVIRLPVCNGKPNFAFMGSFIAELEAERIAELEAYLLAAGLKDYNLTSEEQAAINIMQKAAPLETLEVTFNSLFENIQQGRRLKKDDQILGEIPFVMAGVTNTGVANYISNPIAKFPENSITIDIFGNTFYRSYAFGAGDDTGVYWSDKKSYSKEQMLFFTAVMGKSLLGKYSYGEKLRSSRSLDFKVNLPAKNGLVNYQFMETLISAVQKLVIKGVVDYADKKLTAAHHATQQSST